MRMGSTEMRDDGLAFSLPQWRLTRWLADVGPDVSDDVRVALIGELYGSWPIFAAGIINSVLTSGVIAAREQTAPFIAWFALEIVICTARLLVLSVAFRAARTGRKAPTDLYILLGVAWSASVGLGASLSVASGHWVSATLACLSGAAMVGGTCFRNFSAPRLAGAMTLFTVGPVIPGVALAREPLLYLLFLQMPLYFWAMSAAAFRLNNMLVTVLQAKRHSEDQARLDALTGLRNRAGLVDALEARIIAHQNDGRPFALLYLDLDHFKPVNDTHGHAAGDMLLQTVALCLYDLAPTADAIARIGGDEFVVLISDVTPEDAVALGEHIVRIAEEPIALGYGATATIGISVGIALSPDHGTDAETLLALADAALYEAKFAGRSCCRLANADTILTALRKLARHGAPRAGAAA
jgi:diguanylate cyclase (GGDEF)-like protein